VPLETSDIACCVEACPVLYRIRGGSLLGQCNDCAVDHITGESGSYSWEGQRFMCRLSQGTRIRHSSSWSAP
jgi:hypothetical protein